MKNILIIAFLLLLVLGVLAVEDQTTTDPLMIDPMMMDPLALDQTVGKRIYIGSKACLKCHIGNNTNDYTFITAWKNNPHLKAFETLASNAALELSTTELARVANPQDDPYCLKCHVTGFNESTDMTMNIDLTEGVGCESCHGAGSNYSKMYFMQNREKAVKLGLIPEPKLTCIKCHNPKSPKYKPFIFEESWKKIKH